jgi:hypothetical protein
MLREPSFEKNMKKLLIITSSGGGGLIQTANAKEQEMLLKNPDMQVVRRDLLKDWLWKPIGEFFINFWNNAQKKGDIPAQLICVYGQFLADIFLHPTIFAYALYTLFKEDVDHIIDTQPLGTSAIIKALRIFNRKRKKNVRLEKVLVDLPTKKATHFFRPIRKLSSKNRKLVQLTSIPPLLEEGETEEQFWRSTCNLSAKEIKIEEVYVRQAFQKFKRKSLPKEPMQMMIRFKNKEELQLMEKTFRKGPIQAKMGPDHALFQVDPSDQMITVLLGSQPAKGATLNYIKKFASLVKESPHRKTHLFAFAADHREGEAESLFRQIADTAHQMEYYPQNLTIIPFSFQSEDVIAPLFFRSNITCTRSGGQTAMELMAVSTGEIWLHSEAKEGKNLLSGMPGWEAASAVYLQKMRGAKIVTPETVKYIDIASIHPNLHAGSDL